METGKCSEGLVTTSLDPIYFLHVCGMHACMYVLVCVCTKRPENPLSCLLRTTIHFLLRQVSLAWNSLVMFDWLNIQRQDCPVFYP